MLLILIFPFGFGEVYTLGQLKQKSIGNQRSIDKKYQSKPLETLNYDYNIRGWLLGVNRDYVKSLNANKNASKLSNNSPKSGESFTASTNGAPIYLSTNYFGYDLGYDKVNNGLINNQTYAKAQYNGNIAGTVWKSATDNEIRKYDFMGLKTAATSSTSIHQLNYIYYPGSNKLQSVIDKVNDNGSKLGDFKYNPATKTNIDYSYDVNSNMTIDQNKNISNISYNYLNLPDTIEIKGKGLIIYFYDASGNKLQKKTIDNMVGKTTITSYVGSAIFQNDSLQYLSQEEGRVRVDAINTGYIFDYYIKDHLGNTRMVLTDDYARTDPILESTHYYPFGLTMDGISSKAAGKLENKFKYNGGNELQSKEFSDGSGLELYDAKNRMYDQQLGRFWQQDQLSGLSYNMSPYVFANNNPILLNDPLGLMADSTKAPGFENSTTGANVLPEITVKNTPKKSSSNESGGFYWPTIGKQQGLWNDKMYARQRDNQPLLQGNEPSWVVDQVAFHRKNFVVTQDYRTMSLAAVLVIASPTLIVGLAPESLAAASTFYTEVSAAYLERSLVLHMQSNLALDLTKRKVLGSILGGAVGTLGKDALYNRTLWNISNEMNIYRDPLNGQSIPKIIEQVVKQADKLDKH